MALERLQKILAAAGVASRRAAEKYVTDGRVKVNGKIVRELGAKADTATDAIEVQGFGVLTKEPLVYILLHKPPGVVTTVSDPEGRQTIIDVLQMSRAVGNRQYEGSLPRVFPVGRLDFDTEGVLLLTNDGELANQLLHPRHHVPKTYVVKIKGRPAPKQLERLRRGVRLKEKTGRLSRRPTAPAEVQVIRNSKVNTWLELTIVEGRHHQVRRMCQAIGHSTLRLIRTEFGGLQVESLPTGAWRFLSVAEVEMLRAWQVPGPTKRSSPRRSTAAGAPASATHRGRSASEPNRAPGRGKRRPAKRAQRSTRRGEQR
ncbi:MAG: pseudouridine synthase [Myxococcota bacterium]